MTTPALATPSDSVPLTDDERWLLNHLAMFGSSAYPVHPIGRRWSWGPVRSIRGLPTTLATKREAVASFEAYYESLRRRYGAERYAAAVAERNARHAAAGGDACDEGPDGTCTECGVALVRCDACGGRGYHRT